MHCAAGARTVIPGMRDGLANSMSAVLLCVLGLFGAGGGGGTTSGSMWRVL